MARLEESGATQRAWPVEEAVGTGPCVSRNLGTFPEHRLLEAGQRVGGSIL